MIWGRLLPLSFVIAGMGCTDLDHFSTNKGEAWCGAITLGGAFRAGFSPRVQMRLRLDAAELDGPGPAGTLSTFEAPSGDRPERRLLDEAELRRVPALENDPLSQLEFGEGRTRNAIFAVTPATPDGGDAPESVLAIVSLKSDDTVEVRLLRPGIAKSGDAPIPEGRRPLFGIFPLTRQVGTCGF